MHSNININVDEIVMKTKRSVQKMNGKVKRFFKKIKFNPDERNPTISMKKQFNDDKSYNYNCEISIFNNFDIYCIDNNIDEYLIGQAKLNYNLAFNGINDNNKNYMNEICIASLLTTFINTEYENKVDNIVNDKIFGLTDDKLILEMYYLAKNKNYQDSDIFQWQSIPKYIYELNNIGINDIYNFINENNVDNKISKELLVNYLDKQHIYIKKLINNKNIFKNLYDSKMSYYDDLRKFIDKEKSNYIFINDIKNLFY